MINNLLFILIVILNTCFGHILSKRSVACNNILTNAEEVKNLVEEYLNCPTEPIDNVKPILIDSSLKSALGYSCSIEHPEESLNRGNCQDTSAVQMMNGPVRRSSDNICCNVKVFCAYNELLEIDTVEKLLEKMNDSNELYPNMVYAPSSVIEELCKNDERCTKRSVIQTLQHYDYNINEGTMVPLTAIPCSNSD